MAKRIKEDPDGGTQPEEANASPNAPRHHLTRSGPDRALLIQPVMPREDPERAVRLTAELRHLAESAGAEVVDCQIIACPRPSPATLIGKGRVAELQGRILDQEIQVVIFNHSLTPIQQRNLERAFQVKVADRTGLILEIFADRAKTREGQMQVDLAYQLYQKSRLVRSWSHLERQKGGVGLRGGPGETQIELDRRISRDRIHKLQQDLIKVAKHRTIQRRERQEIPLFLAALVGYTNSGKSTLFNRLTNAGVLAEDRLFATLDPTMRGISLSGGIPMILSDTVGFIRDLPHQLVAAFQATLEEVREADLLLRIVDLSDPEWEEQLVAVQKVLEELGVGQKPMLTLYNKVDQIPPDRVIPDSLRNDDQAMLISAQTGEGMDRLLEWLRAEITREWPIHHLIIPATDGKLLADLHAYGRILQRYDGEESGLVHLTVALPAAMTGRLRLILDRHATAKPRQQIYVSEKQSF